MAISGAFGAGFAQGFGQSLKEGADKRFAEQQRYIDNMMDNARRLAPKYAQDKATADAQVELMYQMENEFGISNKEFIALAQTYDINKVYETIATAQASLPEGRKITREKILSSIKIPEGSELPEGMSAEDAVRARILGYVENLNENPSDKSDAHDDRSWAKAISKTLVLNPRASAEEQIQALKVAGVNVSDLLQYEAMQGANYKPLQGVQRTGAFNLDAGDYRDADYESTVKTYTRTFRSNGLGKPIETITDMKSALAAQYGEGVNEAVFNTFTGEAGIAMGELEYDLYNNGFEYARKRNGVLLRIGNEVNTREEMENLVKNVDSGVALRIINESMQKDGKLTKSAIQAILSADPNYKSDNESAVTPPASSTLPNIEAPAISIGSDPSIPELGKDTPVSGPADETPSTATLPKDGTPTGADPEVSDLVKNIKGNEKSSSIVDEIMDGPASAVAGRQEEYKANAREAASKMTYDVYQKMLETKQGRESLKEMGLPVRGADRALAFGVMNPKKYFKAPIGTEAFDPDKDPVTEDEFPNSDAGQALLNYLIDDEGFTEADSEEEILEAVQSWFGDNATRLNVAEVDPKRIARIMKYAISNLADE